MTWIFSLFSAAVDDPRKSGNEIKSNETKKKPSKQSTTRHFYLLTLLAASIHCTKFFLFPGKKLNVFSSDECVCVCARACLWWMFYPVKADLWHIGSTRCSLGAEGERRLRSETSFHNEWWQTHTNEGSMSKELKCACFKMFICHAQLKFTGYIPERDCN